MVVAELEERSFLSQRRLNPGSNPVLCNFVFMLSTGDMLTNPVVLEATTLPNMAVSGTTHKRAEIGIRTKDHSVSTQPNHLSTLKLLY